MNAEQEEEFRQERVKQSEGIKANIAAFKACAVCCSVSKKTAGICNVCHSYQWDESPETVKRCVEEAAQSAFPITLGHAPTSYRWYYFPVFGQG